LIKKIRSNSAATYVEIYVWLPWSFTGLDNRLYIII